MNYVSTRWPETRCIGLDFSEVAISLAKRNAPKAEFICADIEDYQPDEKFDIIILSGVAEHFDDPLKKLTLIRKLLKDTGILYLEVPNCISYKTFKENREGYFRINQGSRQMEWHYYRPTWERIIAEAGYEVVKSIKGSKPYWEFIWILAHGQSQPTPQ